MVCHSWIAWLTTVKFVKSHLIGALCLWEGCIPCDRHQWLVNIYQHVTPSLHLWDLALLPIVACTFLLMLFCPSAQINPRIRPFDAFRFLAGHLPHFVFDAFVCLFNQTVSSPGLNMSSSSLSCSWIPCWLSSIQVSVSTGWNTLLTTLFLLLSPWQYCLGQVSWSGESRVCCCSSLGLISGLVGCDHTEDTPWEGFLDPKSEPLDSVSHDHSVHSHCH